MDGGAVGAVRVVDDDAAGASHDHESFVVRLLEARAYGGTSHWVIGDILVEYSAVFGPSWKALSSEVGMMPSTLSAHYRTALAFPPGTRGEVAGLPAPEPNFSVYRAASKAAEPLVVLEMAVLEGLNSRQVYDMVYGREPKAKVEPSVRCPVCASIFEPKTGKVLHEVITSGT